MALCACTLVLGGCAKNNASTDTASPTPVATVTDTPAAGAVATDTPSGAAAQSTGLATAVAAASPAAVAAAPASAAAVAFTDIAGANGETAIRQLGALEVFGPATGAFNPTKPIARRDFIRWLVRANNALWSDTPAKQVHLADSSEPSVFKDITPSDPDFPYIQGMQDAGYSVGFPDKTFRPDAFLTREQMFAIKQVFDRGSVDAGLVKNVDYARNTALPPWKDRAQISKTYVGAIATGNPAGVDDNFTLVYGASSLFHPQLPVTRAQAALLLTAIGDHTLYGGGSRTAAHALAAVSPTP